MKKTLKMKNASEIKGLTYNPEIKSPSLVSDEQKDIHGEDNVILSIDNLSKSHAARLQQINEEIRTKNQMLNDGLNVDGNYHDLNEKIKALSKERTILKKTIMDYPGNKKMTIELKDLRQERKEKQMALSDYLLELERMTGVNQLELFDGTVFEIKKVAKLIKKRNKK